MKLLTAIGLVGAALVVAVVPLPPGAQATSDLAASARYAPKADGASCALNSFDNAAVGTDSNTKTVTLTVKGDKAATNVTVDLVPVTYVQQPDYWVVLVVGCVSGAGIQVITPYTAVLDVTSTLGTRGITVQGSNKVQVITVG